MINLLTKISLKHFGWSAVIWTILCVFELGFYKFLDSSIQLITNIYGFFGVSLVTAFLMNSTRWPMLWRRVSSNIRIFWIGLVAVQLINFVFNGIIYLFLTRALEEFGIVDSFTKFEIWDGIWVFLILQSFNMLMINDPKKVQETFAYRPVKKFIGVFVGIVAGIGLLVAWVYSRLLGYMLAEIYLISAFYLQNTFVTSSIQSPQRFRLIGICILNTVIVAVLGYHTNKTEKSSPSSLLGKLGPQKIWSFSEIEKIDKPSAWIDWVSEGLRASPTFTFEQMNTALIKLETICPVMPSDSALSIECEDKDSEHRSVNFSGKSDQSAVLSRIKSPNIYVKTLGIVSARKMESLPEEVRSELKKISQSPGRLSPIAETTLAGTYSKYSKTIKFSIKR